MEKDLQRRCRAMNSIRHYVATLEEMRFLFIVFVTQFMCDEGIKNRNQ